MVTKSKKKDPVLEFVKNPLGGFTAQKPSELEKQRQLQVQQEQEMLRQQVEAQKTTALETPRAKLTTPETFTNPQTGRASGITLPDGRTFLGLGPEDVNQVAQGEAARVARPANTQPVGTAQNQLNTQLRNQKLVELAQQGLLTPEEFQGITGASLDVKQALGAGAIGVLPGLAGGAATGLLAGAVGGATAGAAAGGFVTPAAAALGALGALSGFLLAARSSIKGQQTGEFAADQAALTKGERMLRSLITDTNTNPQNAPENIALFYQTLNMIDAAHMKTWKDSQEDLNRFLGNDGTPQLAKFTTFDDSMRLYYINRFETALAQPDPSQILITTEELEAYNNEEI